MRSQVFKEPKKPKALLPVHLTYLDELRQSGDINMNGAWQYLQNTHDLETADAKAIMIYWMKTYSWRHQL